MKSVGVVFCHPLGHEYYRAYRACVKLAHALAEAGFPTIRFDYLGTGDSDGDTGHPRLDGWVRDALAAADELKHREDVQEVAFGGLRFGAIVAALAARADRSTRALLLWDEIEDGNQHVASLEKLHSVALRDLERFPRDRTGEDALTEILGSSYTRQFLADLRKVRVSDVCQPDIVHVRAHSSGHRTSRAADALKGEIDYGWQDRHRLEESVVDPALIGAFVSRLNAAVA